MGNKTNAKIDIPVFINYCNYLAVYLDSAYKDIKEISLNLRDLMKGDKEGPYWNGYLAKKTFNQIRRNVEIDVDDYNDAVKVWEALYNKCWQVISSNF